jgi:hypothetical protein
MEHMIAYLNEHGKDFCTYLPYYLEGKALEWGRGQVNMLRAENRLSADQLQQDFLLRYDDLLFSPAKKSRDKLFDRSYAQQKGETFAAYQQRFREIIRDATDMSHADKIEWFVRGMRPELEAACTTNRGRMWENLDEVIEYANGKDIAMRISTSRSNKAAVSLNAMHAPSGNRNGNGKRPHPRAQSDSGGWTQTGKRPRGDSKTDNDSAKPKGPRTCSYCNTLFEGSFPAHAKTCPPAKAAFLQHKAAKGPRKAT